MVLDFLKLHDKNLAKSYSARPKSDPTPKRRSRVIEGIDKMLAALKSGEDAPKRGWYSIRGDVARVQLKHGNKVLSINGENEFYVPHERAADFYTNARKSAEAGQMDEHINALFDEGGDGSRAARRKRGPMDPAKLTERNRKRAATLAAKKKQ